MNRHTEGPWYVASTGNHQGLVIDEDTGKDVAVCYDKADAPLIAAAPALLAACKNAAWYLGGPNPSDTLKQLRAAIAEAEPTEEVRG